MARQMRLFLVVLMSLGAAVMNAQVTTSAMSGHVSDELGEDVISALVRVVHQPSGTTYSAITNTDGRWAIQGMRVGWKSPISGMLIKPLIILHFS